ncbi:MAG TPA: LuxR C-terminal-related transcriptional regulator [Alphaproteobacteria bacterium]
MPGARHVPERTLAESAMLVAESRTLNALGRNCRQAIGRLTGSSGVGLYWLNGDTPELLYSTGVDEGFHDDYETGLGKSDPFIDSILRHGRVVDGLSLIGAYHWPRSIPYDLLRTWGFCHDMCGPLRFDGRVVGVFYTANRGRSAPYTEEHRERMDVLCRATSLALAHMVEAGILDARTGPVARARAPDGGSPSRELLPPRAAEVARLLCRGKTNKEIARDMGISDQTVKEHVAGLCRRFGALNRTELAVRLQRGLLRA